MPNRTDEMWRGKGQAEPDVRLIEVPLYMKFQMGNGVESRLFVSVMERAQNLS